MATEAGSRRQRAGGRGRALARHLRRAAGRDGNPLCRPVDRARSRLLLLTAAALVTVLLVACAVTWQLLHLLRADAREVAGHRHRVTATTLADASGTGRSLLSPRYAEASWDDPVHGRGRGRVEVPARTTAGSRVPVWVDDAGVLAGAPRTGKDATVAAVALGLGGAAPVWAVLGAGYLLRRRALDGRAVRSWEPAWLCVEPRWSGRGTREC